MQIFQKFIDCFKRSSCQKEKEKENRIIKIPLDPSSNFCNNRINTALYSPLTFFPLFLIDQFSKLANVYFLGIGLLEQIPNVSPVGRYITLIPLGIILAVSALKEIIEDIKRRSSDKRLNSLKCEIFCRYWRRATWGEIRVGDIVRISSDQTFPADMVLLNTSEPNKICYIQTASLDGETNYKFRNCLDELRDFSNEEHWAQKKIEICCEPPNNNLYKFNATIQIDDDILVPIDNDNIILRGSQLKNTHWVIGVVVYTGSETKIMLNSSRNHIKRSTVDYATNWLVLCLMAILFFLTIACALFYEAYLHEVVIHHEYLGNFDISHFTFHLSCITFFILYHNIIPISLVVTLEIVKMIQSYVISHDPQLYSTLSRTYAIVKTSSIIEELGQINYLFTDKTGTLTCNEMVLKEISIGKNSLKLSENKFELMQTFNQFDDNLFYLFISNLLLCNTVIPEYGNTQNDVLFQSSSPDETAIVSALYESGYKFIKRNGNEITLQINGNDEKWLVLTYIDFTSFRKRMSVIVKSPQDEFFLFIKGADNVIMERLADKNGELYDYTLQYLESFAINGLRTLCIAYKKLSPEECKNILMRFHQAYTSVNDRETEIEKVADEIENELCLLGATGIEDKLQNYVPETIRSLRNANIRIWMLTGDKLETAINVGYSCKLLDSSVDLKILSFNSIASCIDSLREIIVEKSITQTEYGKIRVNPEAHKNFSLVITGKDLSFALDPSCAELFLDVVIHCKTMICCRISPLQKQNVLLLIKERVINTTTLAIGDGANDCSMIKTANVGVGIIGKEGMQAANTADFAIGEFSHLTRLLFVHGAASYRRICNCIYFCFYKNIVFNLLPFFYDFFNMFSGQVIFSRVHMAMFNVVYTSLPPFCFGLLDQSCSLEAHYNVPYLYESMRKSYQFGIKRFSYWMLNGILHSMLLFFLVYSFCYHGTINVDGSPMSMHLFGNILFTHTLIVITLKASLEIRYWFWLTHVGICGGFIGYMIFLTIFCRRLPSIIWLDIEFLDSDILMYESPLFWISLGIPLMVLLPDILFHCIRNTWFTPSYLLITEFERLKQINWNEPENIRTLQSKLDRSYELKSRRTKKYFGFAFSMAESANIRKLLPRMVFKPKQLSDLDLATVVLE